MNTNKREEKALLDKKRNEWLLYVHFIKNYKRNLQFYEYRYYPLN